MLLPSENNLTLTAYCDSDWEVVRQLGDQYLDIAFFLVHLLSQGSQKNVSRSSAEAEYRAMARDSLVAISVAGFKGAM